MSEFFDPTWFNASQAQADADRAPAEPGGHSKPLQDCDDCHQTHEASDLMRYTETLPTWSSPREELRLCVTCLNARIQRTWPASTKDGPA